MSYFEGGIALQASDIERVEQQWTEESQAVVDAVAQLAQEKSVVTTALAVKSDTVSDAILATVAKYHCDLIVMASHGRSGIQRLLMGSETQHVLTHATVPVLVVR